MFTNISDMYQKYATYKNSAKCNLSGIKLKINSWKKDQNKNPEKEKCHYQIYISITVNIPSGREIKHFSTISEISCIIQVYAHKPRQSM